MKNITIAGYATIDYVVQLNAPFHGRGTVGAEFGPSGAWPRPGGVGFYAGCRIAASGLTCELITWLGDDAEGEAYVAACRLAGVSTNGIAISRNTSSPRCLLAYQPDGGYACFLDVAGTHPVGLSDPQIEVINQSDCIIIGVGPAAITTEVLGHCDSGVFVAWVVKIDDATQPAELRSKLAARADIVFCNSDERSTVDKALRNRPGAPPIIIETKGKDGILIEDGEQTWLKTDPLDPSDTTGAGDTFAGEVIAHLMREPWSLQDAAQAGMHAARLLLSERT